MFGDCAIPAAVAGACDGIEGIIDADGAVLPAHADEMLERQAQWTLVELAHTMGVRQFVYVTVPESFHVDCLLLQARNELCNRLARRYKSHTIVFANFFMETWLSGAMGFDYRGGKVTIFGDGTHPIAWVSYHDVANAAVYLLMHPDARHHHVAADGPENITPLDVVRLFEESSGGPLEVTHAPESALKAEYAHASDPIARSLAALKLEYARGCPASPHRPENLAVRPSTSLHEYANTLMRRATARF